MIDATNNSALVLGTNFEKHKKSYFLKCKRNQRHNMSSQKLVYFLKEGELSVFRNKDDMLTITINSPAIFGLSFINDFNPDYYLRCATECDIHVLALSDTIEMLEKGNLWKHAFLCIADITQKHMKRDSLVIQKNVHAIVMEHLKVIWSTNEDERKHISIYTYILERNIISRSAIHKALSYLQNQNVIRVERGKLVAFNDRRQS